MYVFQEFDCRLVSLWRGETAVVYNILCFLGKARGEMREMINNYHGDTEARRKDFFSRKVRKGRNERRRLICSESTATDCYILFLQMK